ncbi:ATP-dependent DNA helicase RecG, partial [candidate division TA06 bacterium]|nr:ATP-dependent DNA helicase RecG [candidate division TA06 bacterium]
EAILNLHFPESLEKANASRRRLAYEEIFYLELLLALRKRAQKGPKKGIVFVGETGGANGHTSLQEKLLRLLPFELTGAQKRVLKEIQGDMKSTQSMHRLLQGDVGSGKTIVALLCMLLAVENGYQAALMAPTEILAEQHFLVLIRLLEKIGVRVVLLVGGMRKKEREEAYQAIESGEGQIIVGTHALIEEGVKFKSLGFVVVDEQHRFGVMQRAKLVRKGFTPEEPAKGSTLRGVWQGVRGQPDYLVMTATPIPRSLSLTLYGDLDISVIDEMPPGRKPILTRWTNESKREKVYGFIRERVKEGQGGLRFGQVYIVYPLVEESEKLDLKAATEMYHRLKEETFPEFQVGLIHGQMKREEKDEIMERFRAGEIQILVSTTVIEVGVDVPNATIMVIEDAERFGLAQLHQLRGRIGRGGEKSYCILITKGRISFEGKERLNTLVATQDGFKIAEKDLRLRGPGEFFGTKQHGLPQLRIADLLADTKLLSQARGDAFQLVENDPSFKKVEHQEIRREFENKFQDRLDLIKVG